MTTKKQLEERIEELENKLGEEQRKWYLFPLFLLSLIITISWVYLSVKYFGLFEVFLILPEETTFMNFCGVDGWIDLGIDLGIGYGIDYWID